MSNVSDFFGGGGLVTLKFQLLTSGTTWTRPAAIVGDTVLVSAIAGGEARNTTGPVGGQGGSYIQKYPYTAGATVAYTIGAAGSGTAGNDGSNTTFGTITLLGGGAGSCTGCPGETTTQKEQFPGGPFGSPAAQTPTSVAGGGGLMFGGTLYGQGGGDAGGGAPGAGAILVEWWEEL